MTLRNIRLVIAYDGGNYSGWQRQKNDSTIQGTIEDSLAIMTGHTTSLSGAGRTDAGVHAAGMVANFHTSSAIPCEGFLKGLNSMLSKDIRVLTVDEAPKDFHSRFNATGKTYSYSIYTGEILQPTDRLYMAHFPGHFDNKSVMQAMGYIMGANDFTSFEATGSRDTTKKNNRGAVRTIFLAELSPHPEKTGMWKFTFIGDGFLRHMIRNLVGTLMEVGSGKLTPVDFKSILNSCNRENAGPTAPACGLVLEKVHYESLST